MSLIPSRPRRLAAHEVRTNLIGGAIALAIAIALIGIDLKFAFIALILALFGLLWLARAAFRRFL